VLTSLVCRPVSVMDPHGRVVKAPVWREVLSVDEHACLLNKLVEGRGFVL